MTVDDICLLLEEEGFRARLSSPKPHASMIGSGHCGIDFNIITIRSSDGENSSIISFSCSLEPMSLSKINAINEDFIAAKAYLDEDGLSVSYRMFINEEDLTSEIFRSSFAAWLGDIETLSRSIGR